MTPQMKQRRALRAVRWLASPLRRSVDDKPPRHIGETLGWKHVRDERSGQVLWVASDERSA